MVTSPVFRSECRHSFTPSSSIGLLPSSTLLLSSLLLSSSLLFSASSHPVPLSPFIVYYPYRTSTTPWCMPPSSPSSEVSAWPPSRSSPSRGPPSSPPHSLIRPRLSRMSCPRYVLSSLVSMPASLSPSLLFQSLSFSAHLLYLLYCCLSSLTSFSLFFCLYLLGCDGQTLGQGPGPPEHLLSGDHPRPPLHHVSAIGL